MDFVPHSWLLAIEEDACETDVAEPAEETVATRDASPHEAASEHGENPFGLDDGQGWMDAVLSDTSDGAAADSPRRDPRKDVVEDQLALAAAMKCVPESVKKLQQLLLQLLRQTCCSMSSQGPLNMRVLSKSTKASAATESSTAIEATNANPHAGRSTGAELGMQVECSMGSDAVQALAAVWAKSRQQEAQEPDRAVDVVLGRVATTASGASVARLLQDVKGSVQDMLLQAGAAVFSVGCWFWCVLLTYMQLCANKAVQGDQSLFPYRFVLLLVKLKYDETPCRICVNIGPDGSHQILSRKDPAEAATHAKIMQVSHTQMALLQHTSSKKFVVCSYNVPTHLTAVDRTTAENIRAVLHDQVTAIPDPLQSY